jgi:hypothetical protein
LSDLEEINELLATNGLDGFSVDGRKNAKKGLLLSKRFQNENKRILLKVEKELKDDNDDNVKKEKVLLLFSLSQGKGLV